MNIGISCSSRRPVGRNSWVVMIYTVRPCCGGETAAKERDRRKPSGRYTSLEADVQRPLKNNTLLKFLTLWRSLFAMCVQL